MYKDGYPLPYVEEMLETVEEFEGMPIKTFHGDKHVGFIKHAWIDNGGDIRMVGHLYKSVDLREFGIGVSYCMHEDPRTGIVFDNHGCLLLEKKFALFECELVNLTKNIYNRLR